MSVEVVPVVVSMVMLLVLVSMVMLVVVAMVLPRAPSECEYGGRWLVVQLLGNPGLSRT